MNYFEEERKKEQIAKEARRRLIGKICLFGVPVLLVWMFFFKMIAPGYVGVIVNLFGDSKGADVKELKVGMHWVAPWKKVYKFPIFQQNVSWEGTDAFVFQTCDGMNLWASMGVNFHLNEDKIHILFAKYRRGIDEITDTFIYNHLRDAINKTACKFKIEDLYGTDKQKFLDIIERETKTDLEAQGIIIDRVYLVGKLAFPDQVVAALNAKIEATQRAQQRENELRETKAQAEKTIAQAYGEAESRLLRAKAESESILVLSRAEAEANGLVARSITSELVRYEQIKKWDGKLPKVSSQSVMPMMSLEEGK